MSKRVFSGRAWVGPFAPLAPFAAIALSALLAACGGGGGGDGGGSGGGGPPVTTDPLSLKGRWVTAGTAVPAFTAIVVPEGGDAGAWLLANDASRLVKLTLRSDNTAVGRSYGLDPAGTAATDVTASFTTNLAATPKALTINGVPAATLVLAQSATLAGPAVQRDAAGTWNATFGGGAQATQWVVTAGGAMTGTSTTGCTYTGNVVAMAGTGAYNLQFTEACAAGAPTAFSGIATVNTAQNALTVVVTSADTSRGVALFFAK